MEVEKNIQKTPLLQPLDPHRLLDPLEDQLVVFAVEGRVAAEEDVEDHSAAPDVALLVVLSFEDLGRDVVGGAETGL